MIHKKGFTLIELLISITIFILILGGLYPVFTQISTFNQENYIKTTLIDNLRAAMDRMSREIKEATKVLNPDDTDLKEYFPDGVEKNSIIFEHPDSQDPVNSEIVRYRLATSSYNIYNFPNGKQLIREVWNKDSKTWEGSNPISEPTITNIIFKKDRQLIKICIISSVILRKGKPAQDYIYLGNIAVRNALP